METGIINFSIPIWKRWSPFPYGDMAIPVPISGSPYGNGDPFVSNPRMVTVISIWKRGTRQSPFPYGNGQRHNQWRWRGQRTRGGGGATSGVLRVATTSWPRRGWGKVARRIQRRSNNRGDATTSWQTRGKREERLSRGKRETGGEVSADKRRWGLNRLRLSV